VKAFGQSIPVGQARETTGAEAGMVIPRLAGGVKRFASNKDIAARTTLDSPSIYESINPVERSKFETLQKSMEKSGWKGDPLLVAGKQLLTGSHRAIAAEKAGLNEIPVVKVDVDSAQEAAKRLGYVDEQGQIFTDDH
jgi:hypothetical protein